MDAANLLTSAISAARAAGQAILAITSPTDANPPDADTLSFDIISQEILQRFPEHAIYSEEQGWQGNHQADYQWIVDPLDGTTNFLRHLDLWVISIAVQHHGETVAAVIHHPPSHEIYSATHDTAATLNGQPIAPYTPTSITEAMIGFGRTPTAHDQLRYHQNFARVATQIHTPRILGSAALSLCYAASGRLDAYLDHNLIGADGLAAALIAARANAKVTNLKGELYHPQPDKRDDIIVAHPGLHRSLLDVLAYDPYATPTQTK